MGLRDASASKNDLLLEKFPKNLQVNVENSWKEPKILNVSLFKNVPQMRPKTTHLDIIDSIKCWPQTGENTLFCGIVWYNRCCMALCVMEW